MTDGFITTIAVVAIGLLAAKTGDLLRSSIIRSSPCDDKTASRVAWSYNPEASQQQDVWQRVRPASSPCA